MALRSALRKMPSLGLRSPPPPMVLGPVRVALSPAAGSRPMSNAAPENDKLEKLLRHCRREIALSNASIDESMRLYEQNHQRMMKHLDLQEKALVVLIACQMSAAVLMIFNHVA